MPLGIGVSEVCLFSVLILSLFIIPPVTRTASIPLKQTVIDNNSQGIDPTIAAGSLPNLNSLFHFNLSETCGHDFDSVGYVTSNISINAPQGYNATNANIIVQVINATLNQTMIVNNTGPLYVNRTQQAQGFFTSADSLFVGFSIYIPFNKGYTKSLTMQLRNESYSGDTIASFPVTLGLDPDWVDVTVSPALFLPKGHYYLYMPSIGGTLTNAWAHTANGNASDTWSYNGLYWSLQNWNLTLKLKTSNVISPTAAGMSIASQSVIDLGNGQGSVNITQNITSIPINFGITNNTPIAYSYTLDATYNRTMGITYNLSLSDGYPNWTLILPSNDNFFHNYQGNITGIQPDYTDIQVLRGTTVIGYTRPDPNLITITSFATSIKFKSPNYLKSLSCSSIVYGGCASSVDVETLDSGNVTVEIYNGSAIIYQNSTISTTQTSFTWVPDEITQPVGLSLHAFYLGINEIGMNSSAIALHVDTSLKLEDIYIPALSTVIISSAYNNLFYDTSIEGADVNFELGELDGPMVCQSSGNYSVQLDLDQYALLPGKYNLTVIATKDGFRSQTANVSFIVLPRPVIIQFTQSVSKLSPGQSVRFDIDISDGLTGTYLDHPVDVSLVIYPAGSLPSDNVTTLTLSHIIDSNQYTWIVPQDLELGEYVVTISIVSDYFIGSLLDAGKLTFIPEAVLWPLLLGISMVSVLAIGIYIYVEKGRSKRSVKGLMVLHSSGAPISELISPSFSKLNSILVSGAISGMITLIREITGSGLRTIRVDGGFLELRRGSTFWIILLMRKSPVWISRTIDNLVASVEKAYGEELAQRNGMDVPIDISALLAQHFSVQLDNPTMPQLPESSLIPKTRKQ